MAIDDPTRENENEKENIKSGSIVEVGPLFDSDAQIRDMSVIEIKVRYRQEQHYFYWLRGFTYKEIQSITGYGRRTIWLDLKLMRDRQIIDGGNQDTIRNEALMNLMFDRALALRAMDANPKQASKFLGMAVDIDTNILARYTQLPKGEASQNVSRMEKQIRWMIDYMIEKMGPDVMDDFNSWWRAKEVADRAANKRPA